MSTAIIVRKGDLSVALTSDAEQIKADVLAGAALIGKVTNASEQEQAVAAAAKIKGVLDLIEKARKAAKEPFLEAGRRLDDTCKAFRIELENEWGRLMHDLVGEFQREERRRIDREKQIQEDEIRRIEAETQAALAKVKTVEGRQAIEEQAALQKRAVEVPVTAAKADGQIIKADWAIEVVNPYDLAKFHPDCVRIEPLLSPIKALLNQGVTVKGIKSTKVINSTVRAPRDQKAIEV